MFTYNLNRLNYFVAIIEEGSITMAAQRLGISKTVVSRQLVSLEEEVNVPLIIRNTRHLRPTDAGQKFYIQCVNILTQATDAFNALKETTIKPMGRLRLTAPVDYGTKYIVPLVACFVRQYEDMEVDLTLTDEILNPVALQFDISFRVGWLEDSSNVARKIGSFQEIAVCHPDLLKGVTVNHPKDLSSLPFIANKALSDISVWRFSKGKDTFDFKIKQVLSMNIGQAIQIAVLAGGGFSILPDYLVSEEIEAGNLVHLLPNWQLRVGGIYAIFPPGKLRSQAVRKFMESVQE